jgi:hypothetical protein
MSDQYDNLSMIELARLYDKAVKEAQQAGNVLISAQLTARQTSEALNAISAEIAERVGAPQLPRIQIVSAPQEPAQATKPDPSFDTPPEDIPYADDEEDYFAGGVGYRGAS